MNNFQQDINYVNWLKKVENLNRPMKRRQYKTIKNYLKNMAALGSVLQINAFKHSRNKLFYMQHKLFPVIPKMAGQGMG